MSICSLDSLVFINLSEGMVNCEMSGKNQGKVREF